jgi:hypothetical protein
VRAFKRRGPTPTAFVSNRGHDLGVVAMAAATVSTALRATGVPARDMVGQHNARLVPKRLQDLGTVGTPPGGRGGKSADALGDDEGVATEHDQDVVVPSWERASLGESSKPIE